MNQHQIIRVAASDIRQQLSLILTNHRFSEEKARECAEIFTTNSLEGVYSHGLNRFPRFIEDVCKGLVLPDKEAQKISTAGCAEQWDGQSGPGPVNAMIASRRAMQLATKYGIGMINLRNTNHWMRGGTYGQYCAQKGFFFAGWTNTIPNLPVWGSPENKLGNNPLVLAVPNQPDPVVLDMAMSQYSYGKLETTARDTDLLPYPGGINKEGEFTRKASEILESQRPLPAGYWKGSSLSFVLDLFVSLLSGGKAVMDLKNSKNEEHQVSQLFLCIDPRHFPNYTAMAAQTRRMINDYLSARTENPFDQENKIHYPGQKAASIRQQNQKNGIPVPAELWQVIQKL